MVITWVRNPPPVLTRAGDNKCHNTIKACDEEDIWYDVPVGHFDTRRSPNFKDLVNKNVGHFLLNRMIPTSFVDRGPKLGVLSLYRWESSKMAKIRPVVTSGYGGDMMPLSWIRPSPRKGGYMGVA